MFGGKFKISQFTLYSRLTEKKIKTKTFISTGNIYFRLDTFSPFGSIRAPLTTFLCFHLGIFMSVAEQKSP